MELEDGMTQPAAVSLIRRKGGNALVEITIHEGRKRQVKRMLISDKGFVRVDDSTTPIWQPVQALQPLAS